MSDFSNSFDVLLEMIVDGIEAGSVDGLTPEEVVGNVEVAIASHRAFHGDAPETQQPMEREALIGILERYAKKDMTTDRAADEVDSYIWSVIDAAQAKIAALPIRSTATTIELVTETDEQLAEQIHRIAGCHVGSDRTRKIIEWYRGKAAGSPAPSAASTVEPVYICYDGYGHHYVSRDPANHTAICYDEDFAADIVAWRNGDTAAPTTSPEPDAVREALAGLEEAVRIKADNTYLYGEGTLREAAEKMVAALSRPAHGGWKSVPPEITDDMRYATWKAQALHVGATELEAIQMANRRMTPEQRVMDQAAYAAMLGAIPRNDRGGQS